MELIRKSDALHAVLHNTGDAAVAAVQNIKPILWTELQGARVKMPEIRTQTLDEYKNPHGELREMLIDEMIDNEWRKEQTDDRRN